MKVEPVSPAMPVKWGNYEKQSPVATRKTPTDHHQRTKNQRFKERHHVDKYA